MNTVEFQTLLEIRNATSRAAQAGKNTVPMELYREQQKELAGAQAYIAALQGQLAATRAQLKTAEDRARLHKAREDVQTENLTNSKEHLAQLDAYHERREARLSAEIADLKKQLAHKG